MKKQLLFLSLIATTFASAQVSNFNNDAFGFELTSVAWTSGGTGGGATSPSNIVDAWTQVAGFEQSSAVKRSGTYSLLADFSTTIPAASPKMQTWRSNTNKEGNFDFDSDAGSDLNYTITGYVYVDTATDGTLRFASTKNSGQFEQVSVNLNTLTPGTWTPFTSSFDFTQADGSNYWSSINFTALPTMNAKIYVDDISIVLTSTLSTSPSKIEGASVTASNGQIVVSGANLDTVYSITGQQVGTDGLASGIYIVKISKGNKQDTVKVIM